MTIEEKVDALETALEHAGNTHTLGDVLKRVMSGSAALWEGPDAVVVTEILEYPQIRMLRIWLAAGALDGVLELAKDIEEWGRSQGCTRMTLEGRAGWQRVLSSDGWTPVARTLSKEL